MPASSTSTWSLRASHRPPFNTASIRRASTRYEVRLAGDLLDVDNHRYLSLPVRTHLRVLCVNGKPAGGAFQGATDYLMVALAPQGETFDGAAIHPEVAPESALTELELSQFDCVFLANVGQFTGNEARVLASYLEQGGGVVFFLGDQVRPESLQQPAIVGRARWRQRFAGQRGRKKQNGQPGAVPL